MIKIKIPQSRDPLNDYIAIVHKRDLVMSVLHQRLLASEIPGEMVPLVVELLQDWHKEKALRSQLLKELLLAEKIENE